MTIGRWIEKLGWCPAKNEFLYALFSDHYSLKEAAFFFYNASTFKGARQKSAFLASTSAKALTPPRAVSGHSDFMQIIFVHISFWNKKSLKCMILKE